MNTIKIGSRTIGLDSKPYFIADIAANHNGDINRACMLIELAKEAGADAAKFQNFKAATIVSKNAFDSMKGQVSHQASWKKSVFEVYSDASIPYEWSPILKEKCDAVGIEYMTTPYDFESIENVDKYLNAYKIGSGDITWIEFLECISRKNKPVILSTGASSLEDVDRAMNTINQYNQQVILLQCNTNYTANKENFRYINLNVLNTYKEKFPSAVLGLSDHTLGCTTVLGAIALGARVIEKHFTDDNSQIGPDHKFSMTPKTWREMVENSLDLYYALGDGIKKIEDNEKDTAIIQRRAIYFTNNLERGHIITKEDLFPLRPIESSGIPPYNMDELIGKKLKCDVSKDTSVKWEMIEI